jgi:hypothetical protein
MYSERTSCRDDLPHLLMLSIMTLAPVTVLLGAYL